MKQVIIGGKVQQLSSHQKYVVSSVSGSAAQAGLGMGLVMANPHTGVTNSKRDLDEDGLVSQKNNYIASRN